MTQRQGQAMIVLIALVVLGGGYWASQNPGQVDQIQTQIENVASEVNLPTVDPACRRVEEVNQKVVSGSANNVSSKIVDWPKAGQALMMVTALGADDLNQYDAVTCKCTETLDAQNFLSQSSAEETRIAILQLSKDDGSSSDGFTFVAKVNGTWYPGLAMTGKHTQKSKDITLDKCSYE